ncbi:SDR family NAD(P)-dependent oxidoreductase [Kaistia dalseonensis]|uniref:NAD(P)-dependent dehydrogenase (Short-subunit alcohol dehydrogenase family) n=1 Tax=Kaistia dalseonensis TaxID=410840 RepID=A0ABU0H9Q1_9HYPH|nr:SDR family NAD(P)-dependent oxidoreductase [Kaistia dalseonensis]MCX5495616.1 SDR family NAD(P)-dependent oxidoreductase [Kaistia dalseonensis]MDQ0438209.1 NAD(P)-dependent dehydrogenase (short-subunit alcohol dehydrogenase family) [Kaistia dalseonensis]
MGQEPAARQVIAREVILVTGAGRGIGRAAAERLARGGAAVGVLDIVPELAEETAATVKAAGGLALALPCDVADRGGVMDAAGTLSAAFGPLTGVVNDAMWIRYGPVDQLAEPDLDRMLAVGLKGPIWGVQALLAHRSDGPVSVVNIASPVADLGMANTVAYTAVKGAIAAITRQLAVELGPQGVRVNAVTPGAVPTPGARSIVDEAGYAKRRAQTPLGRLGEESEIAAAIAFLCGPDAGFITGEVLHVDGGITVKSM